jgi:hypothetical protein
MAPRPAPGGVELDDGSVEEVDVGSICGDVRISHLEAERDDAQETVCWASKTGQRGVTVPVDLREEQQCHAWSTAPCRSSARSTSW